MTSPAIHHLLIQDRAVELREAAQRHAHQRTTDASERTIRRVAAALSTRRNRRIPGGVRTA